MDEKSYGNVLICGIACKALNGAKLFCIRFDKIDRFIREFMAVSDI